MRRQSIVNLTSQPGAEVCEVFRVCDPAMRVSKNNTSYHIMRLADVTGQISGFAWSDKYKGDYHPENNDIARVSGKTKICPTNGTVIVDIKAFEPVPRIQENPIALLPPQSCENLEDLQQLMHIIDALTSISLKKFLHLTFSKDSLTLPFITCPSSRSWHHSEAGGNLRHSLECAAIVARFEEIPITERELGIVGALLHDIGKIRMYYNGSGYAPPAIQHDALTLEILAEPLRMLDYDWPDGAARLRQIWTHPILKNRFSYKNRHTSSVVDLVWFADSLSAAQYKENTAFKPQTKWKRYAKLHDITYWRPSSDNYMECAV